MSAVTIRPAAAADLETLVDLYYDFHEFHACGVPQYLRSLAIDL